MSPYLTNDRDVTKFKQKLNEIECFKHKLGLFFSRKKMYDKEKTLFVYFDHQVIRLDQKMLIGSAEPRHFYVFSGGA